VGWWIGNVVDFQSADLGQANKIRVNPIAPLLNDEEEAAEFERFMQERKPPPSDRLSPKEPGRFRATSESPEAKNDFDQLLKKLETDRSHADDPDWAKFQSFLTKQAQSFPPNDSGKGTESILPRELNGLNWGACLLNVIWGAKMSIPGGTLLLWFLLLLFPVIGWIFPFYLLFKGNELAWQYRKWESLDEFRESQKKWTASGFILLGIFVVAMFIMGAWLSMLIRQILHA